MTLGKPRDPVLLAVLAASAALFAPLVWPLFTWRAFVAGDLRGFHIPLRYVYRQALVAGDSILWTPSIFSGFYLHGEGQIGMLHPLHLILYRFLPLTAGIDLELAFNYVAAFAGMFLFLKRLRLGAASAAFGAMLFAFCGFGLFHHHHLNLVAVVAHIPWLLFAADVLLGRAGEPPRAGVVWRSAGVGFAGVALALASGILLGFPQAVLFNLIALAAFALFRVRETPLTRLLWLAGALATGALIGAIQWMPTADAAGRSIRPLMPSDFPLLVSLHPVNLLQLISPYVLTARAYAALDPLWVHEFTIYSGAFLIVALPWLWIRRRALGVRRRFAIGAIAFAVVMTVMALGRYGGLYVAMTYIPGFRGLRAPSRFIALVQLPLIVLAAIAFDDLAAFCRVEPALPWRRLWPIAIPATLSVLATLLLNTRVLPVLRDVPLAPARDAAMGTALFLAVTLCVALAGRKARWALAALIVVTAADLWLWGMREVLTTPPQAIGALVEGVEGPTREPGGEYLFVSDPRYDGNLLVLRGYRLASGYAALPPAMYFHYTSIISRQLSGAHWEYSPSGKIPYAGAVDRARLVAQSRYTGNHQFGVDWSKVDLHTTALVDVDLPPLVGPPGSARVVVDRPGHLVVDITTPGTQLLALTERYHPGWRATGNGAALTTVAIHGDFLGCVVTGGTTRVEFRFEPDSYARGRMLTIVGIVALALVWMAAIIHTRRG